MKKIEAIQILQNSRKNLFSLSDLKKLMSIEEDNTAYHQAMGLIKAGVLERVVKGMYLLSSRVPSDFEVANCIYTPSYISLESALNYYGILIQTPQQILSITTNITKQIYTGRKCFSFRHLNAKYFTDYQKVDNFLIATPEKALIDSMFFVALGRGSLFLEELLLDKIDVKRVKELASKIENTAFIKYFKTVKL
ncbi:hypothetical protein HZA38_01945 [Candidatus Peregrinibacteria bacterium]|nr:hypothetical protein [Candidatus Peregrinibacteria bacterium]